MTLLTNIIQADLYVDQIPDLALEVKYSQFLNKHSVIYYRTGLSTLILLWRTNVVSEEVEGCADGFLPFLVGYILFRLRNIKKVCATSVNFRKVFSWHALGKTISFRSKYGHSVAFVN